MRLMGPALYLIFCLALLLWPQVSLSGDDRGIDEIGVQVFLDAACHESQCLFTYGRRAEVPLPRWFLYDLDSERGRLIEDGRIAGIRVVTHGDGFVLISGGLFKPPRFEHIDKNGKFEGYTQPDSIVGWEDGIAPTKYFGYHTSEILMSYEVMSFDKPDPDEVFLGVLDLSAKKLETHFSVKKKAGHRVYWVPIGASFLLIDTNSGKVDIFTANTFLKQNVLPAMEERPSPELERFKKLGDVKVPAHMMKYTYINHVVTQGDLVSFRRNVFVTEDKPTAYCYTIKADGSFERTIDRLPVHRYRNKEIVYEVVDKEFSLVKTREN